MSDDSDDERPLVLRKAAVAPAALKSENGVHKHQLHAAHLKPAPHRLVDHGAKVAKPLHKDVASSSRPIIKHEQAAPRPKVKPEPTSPKLARPAVKHERPSPPGSVGKVIMLQHEPSSQQGSGAPSSGAKPAKVKKEYELPGQTRETPPETDPVRKFYTSLLDQNPTSEMAQRWCIQYGVLPLEEARRIHAELRSVKGLPPVRTPVKSEPTRPRPPPPKRKAVAALSDSDSDDQVLLKRRRPEPPKRPAPKPSLASRPPPKPGMASPTGLKASGNHAQAPRHAPAPKVKLPENKPRPAAPPKAAKQDVAFSAGRLDELDSEDDEDDMPLAARRK